MNEVVNPGESLAKLYEYRNEYLRNIRMNSDGTPESNVAKAFYKKELAAVDQKIAIVEESLRIAGKFVRLI